MTPFERVQDLLYLLMRHHLPTATVSGLIDEIRGLDRVSAAEAPELAAMAERYTLALLGEEPEPESGPEDEGGPRLSAVRVDIGEGGIFFTPPDDPLGHLGPEMVDWLAQFDERIVRHPFFAEAVSEAAEQALEATSETAQLVYRRAQEMKMQADGGSTDG